jgi:hypothetical protein
VNQAASIARRPGLLPIIREQVTPAQVAAFFAHQLHGEAQAWKLPGLRAINCP